MTSSKLSVAALVATHADVAGSGARGCDASPLRAAQCCCGCGDSVDGDAAEPRLCIQATAPAAAHTHTHTHGTAEGVPVSAMQHERTWYLLFGTAAAGGLNPSGSVACGDDFAGPRCGRPRRRCCASPSSWLPGTTHARHARQSNTVEAAPMPDHSAPHRCCCRPSIPPRGAACAAARPTWVRSATGA